MSIRPAQRRAVKESKLKYQNMDIYIYVATCVSIVMVTQSKSLNSNRGLLLWHKLHRDFIKTCPNTAQGLLYIHMFTYIPYTQHTHICM